MNRVWRTLTGWAAFIGLYGLTALALAGPPSEAKPAITATKSPSYKQTVLATRPAAYWRLDEKKGPTALDASGNKRHAVYKGKPLFGQAGALLSEKNSAIGLAGPKSKAYVEAGANEAFSVATSGKGLTVEVWMRPDLLEFPSEEGSSNTGYLHWLGKGEKGAFEWGLRFYAKSSLRPNRISAYIWNPAGDEGAGAYVQDPLKPREWIHLVATYDPPGKKDARVQIFKNGEPSKNNTSPGTLYSAYAIKPAKGKAPVRLGTRDLRGFLTGGLDEVAIYPRVLTAQEIREHYQVGVRSLVAEVPVDR